MYLSVPVSIRNSYLELVISSENLNALNIEIPTIV